MDNTEAMDSTELQSKLLQQLESVIDPELGCNIVELGMVQGISVQASEIQIKLALTTMGCPLRAQISTDIKAAVKVLAPEHKVTINWVEMNAEEKAAAMQLARKVAQQNESTRIPDRCRVIGVASGKGGVGKSSVSVNLAVALAYSGFSVGFIDADIWGFSTPRMLDIDTHLQASNEGDKPLIKPATKAFGTGLLSLVSMGLLTHDESSALMWRGLMLNRAVQHFCEDVEWPEDLDYMIIDLPPGTGDVAMGLALMVPRTEVLVVTTPSLAAQRVAVRAVSMARKSNLRVIGVVENMSYYEESGQKHEIFGSGGGAQLADDSGLELLAQIPIEPEVASGGDTGQPIVLQDSPAATAIRSLAIRLNEQSVDLSQGCSARLLDAIEAALD